MAVRNLSSKLRLHYNPLIAPPGSGGVGRSGLNRRIAVSRRWRFAYYRVPKAANSTVILTLAAHDPEQADTEAWTAHQAKRDAYVAPTDLGLIAAFAAARRYTAFTFVRDPYTRVLSAYLDKVANVTNPRSARRAARRAHSCRNRRRPGAGHHVRGLRGLSAARWLARQYPLDTAIRLRAARRGIRRVFRAHRA